MAPTTSATPPPPPPSAVPVKKKTSPWVWVLVGCLGLFVICGVIFGVATFFIAKKAKGFVEEMAENPVKKSVEMMVRMNPDLELVSTDDEAETMTIKDKKTGEVSTFNWSDIQNGKMTFESDGKSVTIDGSEAGQGRMTVQDENGESTFSMGGGAEGVPSWFPAYHDASEVAVLVNANQNGQQSTIWTFKSGDEPPALLAFYQQNLVGDGWEVTVNNNTGATNGSLEGKKTDGAKTINMVVTKNSGEPSQAMVTYTEGNPTG